MATKVEIIGGDHIPPIPYMVVNNRGMHVDLSEVRGELWDPANTAKVVWGIREVSGRVYGTVQLKNGQGRKFYDASLIQPYLNAYLDRYLEEKQKHEANLRKRASDAAKAKAKRDTDDAMVRAIRAQVEQEMARG